MADIEGLRQRLLLDAADMGAATALIQALRRRGLLAEARQVALEAAARAAEVSAGAATEVTEVTDAREGAAQVRRALWSLPWAGAAAARPWLCVLRAALPPTVRLLAGARVVALPDDDGGDRQAALWHHGGGVATRVNLATGGCVAAPLHIAPPKTGLRVLRDSPWRALEGRFGGLWHGAALSPDRSRLALLHDREGLLLYAASNPTDPADPAGALHPTTPALHLPDSLWLSHRALVAADTSAALALDPWTTPGAQRWTYQPLMPPYIARTYTTHLPNLRGWHTDAALSTLALWTDDGALHLLCAATGMEAARFHLPSPPTQAALSPDARWLCCALPSSPAVWVFA